jgi:hypothetical protein
MSLYVAAREGATPVAGEVLLALTTAVDEFAALKEIAVSGEATSSAVNRMAVRRSTSEGTTPTAQTPAKMTPWAQAALTAAATTFSAEPTTATVAAWTYAFNAFGGVVRWIAAPGQEIVIAGATSGNMELSLESSSGTGLVSCQLVWEEP